MVTSTRHMIVVFDRFANGQLMPVRSYRANSAEDAKRRVVEMARSHAGAIAFSRSSDPDTGAFQGTAILAQVGEVDTDKIVE